MIVFCYSDYCGFAQWELCHLAALSLYLNLFRVCVCVCVCRHMLIKTIPQVPP